MKGGKQGQDIYRYFIKVVPTRIYHGFFGRFTMAYQYSVTFLKQLKEGEHSHGGILFEYEFNATVIEIREVVRSFITLLIRLCAVIGGVYATSCIINNITHFNNTRKSHK
uniref:COPIIcoated_ERV domain-containing protein n=1 Tax=Heterorhabditis bacteriophora TaxID=37862 RepID=A0A1I7XBT2_HETBA